MIVEVKTPFGTKEIDLDEINIQHMDDVLSVKEIVVMALDSAKRLDELSLKFDEFVRQQMRRTESMDKTLKEVNEEVRKRMILLDHMMKTLSEKLGDN